MKNVCFILLVLVYQRNDITYSVLPRSLYPSVNRQCKAANDYFSTGDIVSKDGATFQPLVQPLETKISI